MDAGDGVDVQDHFAVLGLDRGASDRDIKAAFRRRIRLVHPDLSNEDGILAGRLNLAVEVLSDPETRARWEYDNPDPTRDPPRAGAAGAPRNDPFSATSVRPPSPHRAPFVPTPPIRWRKVLLGTLLTSGVLFVAGAAAVVSATTDNNRLFLSLTVGALLIIALVLMGAPVWSAWATGYFLAAAGAALAILSLVGVAGPSEPVLGPELLALTFVAVAGGASWHTLLRQRRLARETGQWQQLMADIKLNAGAVLLFVLRSEPAGPRTLALVEVVSTDGQGVVVHFWGAAQAGDFIGLSRHGAVIGSAPRNAPASFEKVTSRSPWQ